MDSPTGMQHIPFMDTMRQSSRTGGGDYALVTRFLVPMAGIIAYCPASWSFFCCASRPPATETRYSTL